MHGFNGEKAEWNVYPAFWPILEGYMKLLPIPVANGKFDFRFLKGLRCLIKFLQCSHKSCTNWIEYEFMVRVQWRVAIDINDMHIFYLKM